MNSSRNSSFISPSNLSFNISRKRTQGDTAILSDGAGFILDSFGSALPSMVKAVLNKVDDLRNVSFRLDRSGWAWLVWKRDLYVWKYVPDAKRSTTQCRKLILPSSELFHNAKLVTVVSTGSPLPGCIAVSPEGHISYWPNISNESATVSINADLPGQECDSLTSVWPVGCILTTTSATVLLIKPGLGAKPSLSCISVSSASKGWLGGLSKRMAYLMPMQAATIETKRASVAVPIGTTDGPLNRRQSANIFLLVGTQFQVWSLSAEGQQCTCDIDIGDIIRKQFHRAIWEEKCDLRGIQIWLLDIRVDDGKNVRILAACLNRSDSGLLNYGIVTYDATSPRIRETAELQIVNYRCERGEGDEDGLYTWKLLSAPSYSLMISHERLLIVGDDMNMDTFHSERAGGPFIGSGISIDNIPLIFTPTNGLFALRANQLDSTVIGLNETLSDVRVPDHLAFSMTQHNLHDLSMSEDNVNRYKSAFLHFCAKRMSQCTEILNSLFLSDISSSFASPQDPVDVWTVALCEKLVDDAPATDSRWASSLGRGESEDPLGLKSKMLIKNFLADKKKGLEIFFSFLRSTGIWQRLGGIIVKETVQSTGSVLYNLYEKIGFAMALHFLQTDGRYRKIVDPAIKSIVALRQEGRTHANLSFNDIFFKDISRVHQILTALVLLEEGVFEGGDPKLIIEAVSATTEVILVLFAELRQLTETEFGAVGATFLLPLLQGTSSYEVSPWYIQSHSYEALTKQANLLVQTSQLLECADYQSEIFKNLEQLTDLILEGLKNEVESLKASDRYPQKLAEFEEKRAGLLGNLMKLDPVGTIPLAEKYIDFNILVTVSYGENEKDRIFDFFEKYYSLGFPFFTFEWFLKQKKDGELIQFFSKSKYSTLLSEYLKDYPSISWHHSTLNEDFYATSKTLSNLASTEESSLDDQKFLFCMSKLALLATGTEDLDEDRETFNKINKRLEIVQFQNELPGEALEKLGIDRGNMRVLTPSQLIDTYTSPVIQPDVINFWKAAQLTDYIPDVREEKKLLIIARAILCEPWTEWGIEHPLDHILPSVLYNFLRSAIANGADPRTCFPLEELSKLDILEEVFAQPNARYLLSACHEHLVQNDVEM